ncbi:MAG TPA: hypothetical protein VMR81_03830 [Patescibacteria group bacterium]|nr:hypothetical protein [Patescibacteria group bacterium]
MAFEAKILDPIDHHGDQLKQQTFQPVVSRLDGTPFLKADYALKEVDHRDLPIGVYMCLPNASWIPEQAVLVKRAQGVVRSTIPYVFHETLRYFHAFFDNKGIITSIIDSTKSDDWDYVHRTWIALPEKGIAVPSTSLGEELPDGIKATVLLPGTTLRLPNGLSVKAEYQYPSAAVYSRRFG